MDPSPDVGKPSWPELAGRLLACGLLFAALRIFYPADGSDGYAHDLVACNVDDTSWVYVVHGIGTILERVLVICVLVVSYSAVRCVVVLLEARALKLVQRTKSTVDDAVVPILGDIARRAIFFFFGVVFLTNLGLDITAVLASTSLISLALAFGAQDYVSVFFGVIVVMFNTPFQVGDEIELPDLGLAGYAEDLSLRYCTVRDYKGSMVMVPNSVFVKGAVLNFSARSKTDIEQNFVIAHDAREDTNTRIQALRKDLKAKIQSYKGLEGWMATRLQLKPEGIGVQLRASFARIEDQSVEWDDFTDAEAFVALTISELMRKHDLTFATHPVQASLVEGKWS